MESWKHWTDVDGTHVWQPRAGGNGASSGVDGTNSVIAEMILRCDTTQKWRMAGWSRQRERSEVDIRFTGLWLPASELPASQRATVHC